MSPTHHSSTSTTNITLSNLTLNGNLLKSSGAKQKLDPTNFTCLSKASDSFEANGRVLSSNENNNNNNNWVEQLFLKERKLDSQTKVESLKVSEAEDEQRKEDLYYLGDGGFSRWGGESVKGGWIRKMGYAERFMTGSTEFGVMATVYNLWFESKAHVDFKTVEEACHIVARKLPHLRLAVGKKGKDLWWKEMDDMKFDIQELQTESLLSTFETLLKKRFDLTDGPLWFVRFVKINEDSWQKDFPNFVQTVSEDDVTHKFILIFGFHHNFSDGTTNMKFCDVFLKVLNNLLSKRPTEMNIEAKLVEPHQDRMADKLWNSGWLLYSFLNRFCRNLFSYAIFMRKFTKFYNQPIENEATTRIIPNELDETTTTRLLQKCKDEKATLNSAFTAAANLALYRMLLTKTSSYTSMSFGGIHTINMRRYWTKEDSKDSCGCHISTIDVSIPTKINDFHDFWSYARKIQDKMCHELNESKRCIKLMPLGERLNLLLYVNSFCEHIGIPAVNDNHYLITNMGNLGKLFSGDGDIAKVTRLMRSISCHYMPNLCQHTLHTFRGRLFYSLDYYTQKMERENAILYAETLTDILKEISVSSGSLSFTNSS